jgi:hypothetical protein
MKTTTIAALSLALAVVAAPAAVRAMTVQEFLTSANQIPRNPTALLRSDTRRLMSEIQTAFRTVREEQAAAQAAGRKPATCIAEGVKISVSPDLILNRFNAIPAHRRGVSVTQAVRDWMAEDHPCPA